LWGYRDEGERPDGWGADALADTPVDLLAPTFWARWR